MALSTSNNSALDYFVFASLNSISVRVLTTASGVRTRCAASAINSSDLCSDSFSRVMKLFNEFTKGTISDGTGADTEADTGDGAGAGAGTGAGAGADTGTGAGADAFLP